MITPADVRPCEGMKFGSKLTKFTVGRTRTNKVRLRFVCLCFSPSSFASTGRGKIEVGRMGVVEDTFHTPVELETAYPTVTDDFMDLMDGSAELDASHAGGEMADLVAAVEGRRRGKRSVPSQFCLFVLNN